MARFGRGLVAGACAAALLGCDAAVKPASVGAWSAVAPARTAFPPVRLSIHPLSRLSRDGAGGALRIEAHVELGGVPALEQVVELVEGGALPR